MSRVTVTVGGETVTVDYTRPAAAALPLLGMSAPAELWDTRKAQVEATGGRLQARRIFFKSLTVNPTTMIRAARAEGLLPVVSFKLGSHSWGQVAAGAADAELTTLAGRCRAASPERVVVILHHEPDQQSTPPDVGEGGTAADFAAMYRRAVPILKAAGNVAVWTCMNGWWWTNQARKLTDAQINVWLPPDVRGMLDGISADFYTDQGETETSVMKARNMAAWARRVGGVKVLGVGEFNGFRPTDLTDLTDFVQTDPLYRGGWALVWNSTRTTYKPLDETGLLDDFQEILRTWPA